MRWLVRGDIDGFFGLALDNLVQLLLIGALCRYVVGLPDDLVTGAILPGAALSILVGNLFYAWQAMKLARELPKDQLILCNLSGRGDKDVHTIAAREGIEL